jgi:PEP-CTERM motif
MQKSRFVQAAAALAVAAAFSQPSVAQTLLDENFNDVISLGSVSNTATPDVCLNANCSAITAGLPTGMRGNSASGIAPAGANLTPANANIRRGDNLINTLPVPDGFGTFFGNTSANGFLVLGDDTNTIADGTPNNGVSFASIPFTVGAGISAATIAFDWAFGGQDANNSSNDSFIARVVNSAGTTVLTMLSLSSESSGSGTYGAGSGSASGYGTGSYATTWNGAAAGTYRLEFLMQETTANASTQSAVGIDNILVAAVPEPEIYALMLAGLGVMGAVARRRRGVAGASAS